MTNVIQLHYNYYMIVLDSSTMILLAKVDLLDTFISSCRLKVAISEKVRDETCVKGTEEIPLIAKLISDGKIEVKKVKNQELVGKIMCDFNIDRGEAEAVILALDKKAFVATDDRNAIRACKLLKVGFTTAISILVRAFEKGHLDREEALIKLEKLADIARYSKAITSHAENLIKGGA